MPYFDISAPQSAYKFNQEVLSKINEIASPLVENFGLRLVTYRRFFNNGDLLHLSMDSQWLEHCCQYHHWTSHTTLKRISLTPLGESFINIWDKTLNSNDNVYGALHSFGYTNGATIYERNANSVELWAFAAGNEVQDTDSIYANYNTHHNILKRFTLYFQDKAKDILDPSDKSKIIPGTPKLIGELSPNKDEPIEKFNKATKISKYFIKSEKGDYPITKREAQCLYYLCQGMTMKEIAIILKINWRTVDYYINNVKTKMDISSTNHLLQTFYSNIRQWVF